MRMFKSLLATAAAGAIGVGAYAALPAASAGPSTVQLATNTAAASPAASPAATPVVGPTASTPPMCENNEWPDAATGQPVSLVAGGAKGFYLWHNDAGWHLEVTHPTHDLVTFTGSITTNGTLAFQRVDDEHNDVVKVGPKDHVISFAFNNHGAIDGVHFETHCADWLQIHLSINGRPATTEQIYVGHAPVHPFANPFTIDRSGVH